MVAAAAGSAATTSAARSASEARPREAIPVRIAHLRLPAPAADLPRSRGREGSLARGCGPDSPGRDRSERPGAGRGGTPGELLGFSSVSARKDAIPMALRIYYDKDADLGRLEGKTVAVLG